MFTRDLVGVDHVGATFNHLSQRVDQISTQVERSLLTTPSVQP